MSALSRVILEDPAYHFGRGDLEKTIEYYTRDIGRPPAELRPEIARDNPGWTSEDIEGKVEAMQKVTREAVRSVFIDAGQEGDVLPFLARLAVPTLLIRADADLGTTLNAANWERAREFLPAHSRAVEIPGATHNVHRSKFAEFMQVVDDFLSAP